MQGLANENENGQINKESAFWRCSKIKERTIPGPFLRKIQIQSLKKRFWFVISESSAVLVDSTVYSVLTDFNKTFEI